MKENKACKLIFVISILIAYISFNSSHRIETKSITTYFT